MNENCVCEQITNGVKPATVDAQGLQSEAAQELHECRQELLVWKDRCVRTTADFENYKRRIEKEQASWIRSSKVSLLRHLLPVIDDVERSLADCAKRERTPENESVIAGIEMMGASFQKFLKSSEVTEIVELEIFDPLIHEAIAQVESPDHESGAIVEVLQKGYMFGDQVLRPAKVSVAK